MMRFRGKSPNKAKREFLEWASLFSGSLFVKLVAYADDSGTHDPTGIETGAKEALIAGLVGPVEDMANLCRRWQQTLNKYKAPCFHFCEWSDAVKVARGTRKASSTFLAKNPFRDWKHETLDRFAIELATIVGTTNSVIVGTGVFTDAFHKEKTLGERSPDSNPYIECANKFFASIPPTIVECRKSWKRMPISFFFDQTDNTELRNGITAAHHEHTKTLRTFREIAFADKKFTPHLPLQAADMVAYRAKQIALSSRAGKEPYIWEEFDAPLFKQMFDFWDANPKRYARDNFISKLMFKHRRTQ